MWILIAVTANSFLINEWDGNTVVHVVYPTEQSCLDGLKKAKQLSPTAPVVMSCIERKKFNRWNRKPS